MPKQITHLCPSINNAVAMYVTYKGRYYRYIQYITPLRRYRHIITMKKLDIHTLHIDITLFEYPSIHHQNS